jgi:maltooligosyltrehalose trehalohydrolase
LGITVLELMPVADFPGRFGWGYDGVSLFAPTRLYGTPDEFREFVDQAHGLGLGVILDVVYNHLGPDGNYLKQFSDDYFTDRYPNEWGEPINFDGKNSAPVREFFLTNAAYWIEEFHLDGLRLDATQGIFDASPEHILAPLSRRVRQAGRSRATYLVAENEPQQVKLVQPRQAGGYGLDALWNDDFHHSAQVALTGRKDAYYHDYNGQAQEFVSMAKWGYLYQGQWYSWQAKPRGTLAFGLSPDNFVHYLQNHDQIANSLRGWRVHQLTSPGRLRALTTLLLLGPATPLLFQGQEFAASAPFLYFADHKPELTKLIAKGRTDFVCQFKTIALPECASYLADPCSEQTFTNCKLNCAERQQHAEIYELHRDLLRLRRQDPVFSHPQAGGVEGAVLGAQAFGLRFFGPQQNDRLLLINLGRDLQLHPVAEPLLAPVEGSTWRLKWSSESPAYGGSGTLPSDWKENFILTGEAALVLEPGAPADSDKSAE